jgi:hypothetical protein
MSFARLTICPNCDCWAAHQEVTSSAIKTIEEDVHRADCLCGQDVLWQESGDDGRCDVLACQLRLPTAEHQSRRFEKLTQAILSIRMTIGPSYPSSSDVPTDVGLDDNLDRSRSLPEDSSCEEAPVVVPDWSDDRGDTRADRTLKQCASVKLSTGPRHAVHLLGPDLAETADMAEPKQAEHTTCFLISS